MTKATPRASRLLGCQQIMASRTKLHRSPLARCLPFMRVTRELGAFETPSRTGLALPLNRANLLERRSVASQLRADLAAPCLACSFACSSAGATPPQLAEGRTWDFPIQVGLGSPRTIDCAHNHADLPPRGTCRQRSRMSRGHDHGPIGQPVPAEASNWRQTLRSIGRRHNEDVPNCDVAHDASQRQFCRQRVCSSTKPVHRQAAAISLPNRSISYDVTEAPLRISRLVILF
jgi:hypothetical protein